MPVRFFNPYEQLFQGLQNLGLGGVQGVNRPYMIEERLKEDPAYRTGIVGAARAIYAQEGEEGLAKFQENLGMRPMSETSVLRDFVVNKTPQEIAEEAQAGAVTEQAGLEEDTARVIREGGGAGILGRATLSQGLLEGETAEATRTLLPQETELRSAEMSNALKRAGITAESLDSYNRLLSQQPEEIQAIGSFFLSNEGLANFLSRRYLDRMSITASLSRSQFDPKEMAQLTFDLINQGQKIRDRLRSGEFDRPEQRASEEADYRKLGWLTQWLQQNGYAMPGDIPQFDLAEDEENLFRYNVTEERYNALLTQRRELMDLAPDVRLPIIQRSLDRMLPAGETTLDPEVSGTIRFYQDMLNETEDQIRFLNKGKIIGYLRAAGEELYKILGKTDPVGPAGAYKPGVGGTNR